MSSLQNAEDCNSHRLLVLCSPFCLKKTAWTPLPLLPPFFSFFFPASSKEASGLVLMLLLLLRRGGSDADGDERRRLEREEGGLYGVVDSEGVKGGMGRPGFERQSSPERCV